MRKLDGLSEYDVRRPSPDEPPLDESDPSADMFATAEEPRELITGLYRAAWAHADATIEALPLDAPGHVPWWPAERADAPLLRILVHVIAETTRPAEPTRSATPCGRFTTK